MRAQLTVVVLSIGGGDVRLVKHALHLHGLQLRQCRVDGGGLAGRDGLHGECGRRLVSDRRPRHLRHLQHRSRRRKGRCRRRRRARLGRGGGARVGGGRRHGSGDGNGSGHGRRCRRRRARARLGGGSGRASDGVNRGRLRRGGCGKARRKSVTCSGGKRAHARHAWCATTTTTTYNMHRSKVAG